MHGSRWNPSTGMILENYTRGRDQLDEAMSRKSWDSVLFCWHLSTPGLLLSSHPARLLPRLLRWSSARCDLFRHRALQPMALNNGRPCAAVKTRAFREGLAIKNGASKNPEDTKMATEDPSSGGRAYPGRE